MTVNDLLDYHENTLSDGHQKNMGSDSTQNRNLGDQKMTGTRAHDQSVVRHSKRTSRIYFVLLVLGLWLGVGLPAVLGGVLNIALLLMAVYSGYQLLSRGVTF